MILIEQIKHPKKHIVELWDAATEEWEFNEPFTEDFYVKINSWCIKNLGYHARTAYNRYEFKNAKDLTLFVLKWS